MSGPAKYRMRVKLDLPSRSMMLVAANEGTLSWMKEPGPAAAIRDLCERVKGMRVAEDPPKWARPLGCEILTPALFAAMLRDALVGFWHDIEVTT